MTVQLNKIKGLASGFIACLVIGLIAQGLATFVPALGAALFAIIIGIISGNTFLNRPSLATGVKFSESRLLEYSIAITGLTLNLSDVTSVGVSGILFIICQMTLTIVGAYYLGRRFGFNRRFALLMSAGNGVCGSSAIGTVSPIVGADEKDKGISITLVNLTGTVLMVVLPLLTNLFYQQEVRPTSAMIGGVLQSVGQVIASGKLVGEEVTQYATIFKIIRIILLVAVALVFSKINASDQGKLFKQNQSGTTNSTKKTKVGVPWFITAFFICSLVVTFITIPTGLEQAAKGISNQFEIIALAGIGMRVKFADLIKEGPRGMALGGAIGLGQIVIATVLIFLLIK